MLPPANWVIAAATLYLCKCGFIHQAPQINNSSLECYQAFSSLRTAWEWANYSWSQLCINSVQNVLDNEDNWSHGYHYAQHCKLEICMCIVPGYKHTCQHKKQHTPLLVRMWLVASTLRSPPLFKVKANWKAHTWNRWVRMVDWFQTR